MSDEVPTPLKAVYIFIDMLALGAVHTGYEEFVKGHFKSGILYILLGAVFLFIGVAGPLGWIKRGKKSANPKDGQSNPVETGFDKVPRKPFITLYPKPSAIDWIFIGSTLVLCAWVALQLYSFERKLDNSPISITRIPTPDYSKYDLSKVSPEEILKQIHSAQPMQQDAIESGYVGATVTWVGYLFEAKKSRDSRPDFDVVMLISTPVPSENTANIFFEVKDSDCGFLKVSKQGDPFVVSGKIDSVDWNEITLIESSFKPAD